jgi:hypothetical protein
MRLRVPVDVFVEEPKIGRPVIGKERASSRAVRLPHFIIPVQDSCSKESLPTSCHYGVVCEEWDGLTRSISGMRGGPGSGRNRTGAHLHSVESEANSLHQAG